MVFSHINPFCVKDQLVKKVVRHTPARAAEAVESAVHPGRIVDNRPEAILYKKIRGLSHPGTESSCRQPVVQMFKITSQTGIDVYKKNKKTKQTAKYKGAIEIIDDSKNWIVVRIATDNLNVYYVKRTEIQDYLDGNEGLMDNTAMDVRGQVIKKALEGNRNFIDWWISSGQEQEREAFVSMKPTWFKHCGWKVGEVVRSVNPGDMTANEKAACDVVIDDVVLPKIMDGTIGKNQVFDAARKLIGGDNVVFAYEFDVAISNNEKKIFGAGRGSRRLLVGKVANVKKWRIYLTPTHYGDNPEMSNYDIIFYKEVDG